MRRSITALLTLLLLPTVAGVSAFAQGNAATELKLGLDHTKVRADKVRKPDEGALTEVLERRVSALSGGSGTVKVSSVDEILVRVPLEKVTAAQAQMLTRPGKLEFRSLDDLQTNLNPDGRYRISVLTIQDKTTLRFQDRRNNRPVETVKVVEKSPLLFDNDDLEPNGATAIVNAALVRARLTEKASKRLESFLKKPGRMIAVVLDGEVVAINAGISTIMPRRKGKNKERKKDEVEPEMQAEPAGTEVDILGGYSTPEEAALLAGVLNSGVLPFPLIVRSQRVVPVE